MSNEAEIRAEIKLILEQIPDIGRVYDFQRLITNHDIFVKAFSTVVSGEDVIRGWTISCTGFSQQRFAFGMRQSNPQKDYEYKIRGRFGVQDNSLNENGAFLIAEAVINELTQTLSTPKEWDLPDLTFEPATFAGIVCHFAEITLVVRNF